MSQAKALPRRSIVGAIFVAACFLLAAPSLLKFGASAIGRRDAASATLEAAIEATRQAETRARAAVATLRPDEVRADLYRARLSDALSGRGDLVTSVTASPDTDAGAGIQLRRIDMSFRCQPSQLATILAAVRSSTPGTRITQVRWDAAAISVQNPDPTLRVTAEAFVAAPETTP